MNTKIKRYRSFKSKSERKNDATCNSKKIQVSTERYNVKGKEGEEAM
jgi:hypothetical protein